MYYCTPSGAKRRVRHNRPVILCVVVAILETGLSVKYTLQYLRDSPLRVTGPSCDQCSRNFDW